MDKDGRKTLARILAAALLALVPVAVLSLSPGHAATGMLILGLLPTLTAAASGTRAMAAAGGASVIVAFAAVLVTGTGAFIPLVGTALVVALALLTGGLRSRGLHPVGAATITFAAYLMVDPLQVLVTLDTHAPLIQVAAQVAGGVLLACGWVLGIRLVLLRGIRLPTVTVPPTLPYGLLLAILCGAFTLACLVWFRGTNAWWSVMTVALILQPTGVDTRTKLNGRIAGTILGGTAAAILASLAPMSFWLTMLGIMAVLASIIFTLIGAEYWLYTSAVTISVVLMTFNEATTAFSVDLERSTITVIAAAVTAATVWAASRIAQLLRLPAGDSTEAADPG